MLGQPSANKENLHAEYGGAVHLAGLGIGWKSSGLK